jgi:vesicular inhibitory amino acid transporter
VVLFSDSLHAVIPALSSNTYKLLALALLIPTAFFPLSIVSYTSLISVFATVFIGIVLVVNGLNKREAPGSLWEGMGTDMAPASAQGLGLSFGIFMAGVSVSSVVN